MTLPRALNRILPCLAVAFALSSCTADPKTADDSAAEAKMAADVAAFKASKKFIDSIITSAPSVAEVAKTKGPIYDVASDDLAQAVLTESAKTRDCYTNALRDFDPKLTGVATILVNFGAAGWDLIRVEDSKWSNPAGGSVESCIGLRAKTEWKLPTKGVKPGAHLVQLAFRPDSGTALIRKP